MSLDAERGNKVALEGSRRKRRGGETSGGRRKQDRTTNKKRETKKREKRREHEEMKFICGARRDGTLLDTQGLEGSGETSRRVGEPALVSGNKRP